MKKLFQVNYPAVFMVEADTSEEASKEVQKMLDEGVLDLSGFRDAPVKITEVTHSGWELPVGWGEETVPLNSTFMVQEFLAALPTKSHEPEISEPQEKAVLPTPEEATTALHADDSPMSDQALYAENADMVRTIRRLVEEGDEETRAIPFLDDCVRTIIEKKTAAEKKVKSLQKRLKKHKEATLKKAYTYSGKKKPAKKKG